MKKSQLRQIIREEIQKITENREPLYNDDDISGMQGEAWALAEMREKYELARSEDAALIQKLINTLQEAVDAWDDGDLDTAIIRRLRTMINTAENAGFTTQFKS